MHPELQWSIGLLVTLILTAALVNRFSPADKPRVRRIVILFGVYVVAIAAETLLTRFGVTTWANRARLVAALFRAFTVVNVLILLGLSVVLRWLGMSLPLIASDLIAGVGYLLAMLGVFSEHGFATSDLLATSAVVSAVLAISLQSTLGNILGGIALQLDGSIHEGDWIQFDNGRQGCVRAVRWRHTVVETRDYSTIIVPNALLLANNIMILGKRGGKAVPQRMWVWFNVDFRYPPSKVVEAVEAALRSTPIPNVANDPPPDCVCMDFAKEASQSYGSYAVRYWLPDMARTDGTGSRVRARVFTALQRAGIPFALPARTEYIEVEDDQRRSRKMKRAASERVGVLRAVPLFRSLTDTELETLAGGMHRVLYTAGEVITRQGAVAHWLYVMISGQAEVRAHLDPTTPGGKPETHVVAKLSAPEYFGEMGLMTGEPRFADVVAISDVECWRLGKSELESVLTGRSEVAAELSERLAARRVELIALREGLDAKAQKAREASERARILDGIRDFFGL